MAAFLASLVSDPYVSEIAPLPQTIKIPFYNGDDGGTDDQTDNEKPFTVEMNKPLSQLAIGNTFFPLLSAPIDFFMDSLKYPLFHHLRKEDDIANSADVTDIAANKSGDDDNEDKPVLTIDNFNERFEHRKKNSTITPESGEFDEIDETNFKFIKGVYNYNSFHFCFKSLFRKFDYLISLINDNKAGYADSAGADKTSEPIILVLDCSLDWTDDILIEKRTDYYDNLLIINEFDNLRELILILKNLLHDNENYNSSLNTLLTQDKNNDSNENKTKTRIKLIILDNISVFYWQELLRIDKLCQLLIKYDKYLNGNENTAYDDKLFFTFDDDSDDENEDENEDGDNQDTDLSDDLKIENNIKHVDQITEISIKNDLQLKELIEDDYLSEEEYLIDNFWHLLDNFEERNKPNIKKGKKKANEEKYEKENEADDDKSIKDLNESDMENNVRTESDIEIEKVIENMFSFLKEPQEDFVMDDEVKAFLQNLNAKYDSDYEGDLTSDSDLDDRTIDRTIDPTADSTIDNDNDSTHKNNLTININEAETSDATLTDNTLTDSNDDIENIEDDQVIQQNTQQSKEPNIQDETANEKSEYGEIFEHDEDAEDADIDEDIDEDKNSIISNDVEELELHLPEDHPELFESHPFLDAKHFSRFIVLSNILKEVQVKYGCAIVSTSLDYSSPSSFLIQDFLRLHEFSKVFNVS